MCNVSHVAHIQWRLATRSSFKINSSSVRASVPCTSDSFIPFFRTAGSYQGLMNILSHLGMYPHPPQASAGFEPPIRSATPAPFDPATAEKQPYPLVICSKGYVRDAKECANIISLSPTQLLDVHAHRRRTRSVPHRQRLRTQGLGGRSHS